MSGWPCTGCGNRKDVIQGALKQHAENQAKRTAAEQAARAAQRLAVVGRHAARDVGRVVRSTLRPR